MISTKGRYALRFMIDLAEQPEGIPIPLIDIAERQNISKKYLEIIVKELTKAKYVKGTSGKGGGYYLLKDPTDITVGEILELLEGTLAPVACLQQGAEECSYEKSCQTLPMWKEFNELVHNFFFGKKISDLADLSKRNMDPTKYSCL